MRKEWKFDALSSELYVVQTTWPLDYHVNIVFIPCMGCILVGVRCLLDTLQFCGFWGQMTSKQKFSNFAFENLRGT